MRVLKAIKEWLLDYIFSLIPDGMYLKFKYRVVMHKKLNLKTPITFNEKIQWLKLYNRKPEYTTMVDKYAVKDFVASKIGWKYIIPTLNVWNSSDEIEWDRLPNEFVLKTTHGGGNMGVIVVKDKNNINKKEIVYKLNKALKLDLYKRNREWPYKYVKKRIIAEKFMKDNTSNDKDLSDYKFYCFNGEPKYCQVIRDRNSKETIDFYDMKWNHMPFVGLNPIGKDGFENGTSPVPKPIHLDKMIEICQKLSCNIPFVRIDLYLINNSIFFGEITFYPASGIGTFSPEEWSLKLGKMIELPR